jgi:transcriptional regulator with XRE-family HTH domain
MSPHQCRAARGLLDMSQSLLAEAAGLSLSTVVGYERQRRRVSDESIAAMKAALEAAGVQFTNGKRPGVRMRKS